MLKELSKYENLGTPSFHFQLLRMLRDNKDERWHIKNITGHFHNRVIDGRDIFDGCLDLLISTGLIEVSTSQNVILDNSIDNKLDSEAQMIDMLVERLLDVSNSDPVFHDIFCSTHISYDSVFRSIQIDNSAFPLRYACFKQLLIDFGVLKPHPTNEIKKFLINKKFKSLFDKAVLPEIKRRKIGLEELHNSLEQNQIYGEEAEKFVLAFEKKRLNGSKEIQWVAEYSTNDGYDIASFETEKSENHDRFIEVKSYNKTPYFFWSRNEIDTARIKRSTYFLYLVDRSMIATPGYVPMIIKDPYENVYKNYSEWDQKVENIRFQKAKVS